MTSATVVGAAGVQLSGLAARAHAQQGNTVAARQELETATELFDRVATEDAEADFFGFPARQLTMYTSSVLSHIGDERAWDSQEEALELYDDDFLERTVILIERAHYLLDHDLDHAAATAADAIADLDDQHRIPLLIDQAMNFADELSHHSPALAADYRSRITTTAT